jgi:N-acetylmuramoyl-L-alanine amidase
MTKIGRPFKISEMYILLLEKAFGVGMTKTLACQHAGISTSTFYTWMSRGRDEDNTIYSELYLRVKKAESNHALANLAIIQNAAKSGTWQASAWLIERRHKEYQRQQEPLIEMKIDNRQISVTQLLQQIEESDQQLKEIIQRPIIDLDEE